MTCKDCIHYEACVHFMTSKEEIESMNYGNSDTWLCFRDKTQYIELPCKVDDRLPGNQIVESISIQIYKNNLNDKLCVSKKVNAIDQADKNKTIYSANIYSFERVKELLKTKTVTDRPVYKF